ncbi:MAG: phosphodiesterase [Gammaproteobacteria bacterium]|nr:MAG: phosphodiesterase [Gammaproteobacteria bacterium]
MRILSTLGRQFAILVSGVFLAASIIGLSVLFLVIRNLEIEDRIADTRAALQRDIAADLDELDTAAESLRRVARLLAQRYRTADRQRLAARFDRITERRGPVLRSRRDHYDPAHESGVYRVGAAPEGAHKVLLMVAKQVMDVYGPASTLRFDDLWFLTTEHEGVVYRPDRPEYLYGLTAPAARALAAWVHRVGPGEDPEREARWTPVSFDAVQGKWFVSCVLPFYLDGRFLGALGHDIYLDRLVDRLAGAGPPGSLHYLRDRQGRVIYAETPLDRDGVDASGRTPLTGAGDWVVVGAVRYLRILVPLERFGWDFTLLLPEDRIVAPLNRYLLANALVLVAIALLVALAIAYFVHARINTRILALAQDFHRFRDDLTHRARVEGEDEIAQLAAGFNRLADKIETDHHRIQSHHEELRYLANHDELTGLNNRTAMRGDLHSLIQSEQVEAFSLVFLDLDHFKLVNDVLGHGTGDELLRRVAVKISWLLEPRDRLYRLGGDEFLILKPGKPTEAELFCRKLLELFRHPIGVGDRELQVTPSIGVCCWPEDARTPENLLKGADLAMYHAKTHGRNTYARYRPEMDAEMDRQFSMQGELRRALENGELEAWCQPQHEIATGEIVGVELLVRWRHPRHGLLTPDRFIGVAESSGLIVEIDRAMLREAVALHLELTRRALYGLSISVNLSALNLAARDLPAVLSEVMGDTGLPDDRIVLEVTETMVMQDVESSAELLRSLRYAGFQVAVDDFGTGYSSLGYLKRLPLDELKIDRSFISDLLSDADDLNIVTSVIELAHSMGLRVVAEGVEDRETFELLRELGCDVSQGYYHSPPVPREEFIRMLAESRRRAVG